jgi:polyhydroxyalkanoate synthesis regulator phasin
MPAVLNVKTGKMTFDEARAYRQGFIKPIRKPSVICGLKAKNSYALATCCPDVAGHYQLRLA